MDPSNHQPHSRKAGRLHRWTVSSIAGFISLLTVRESRAFLIHRPNLGSISKRQLLTLPVAGALWPSPEAGNGLQIKAEKAYARAEALSFNTDCSRILDTATMLFHDPRSRLQHGSPSFLLQHLPQKQVILLGEEHNHPIHSASELDLLKALHGLARESGVPLTLGLEMFDHTKDHKEALKEFIFGSMTLSELKRQTEMEKRWGWPIASKSKLMHFAKKHQITVFGCNAPLRVNRYIEEKGVDGLLGRPGMPQVDLSNMAHRERFFAERHSYSAAMARTEEELQHAYEAQAFREDWMASSVAAHAKEREGLLLVIAGRNHVAGRLGLPCRVRQRLQGWADPLTVVMHGAEWNTKKRSLPMTDREWPDYSEADWVWYVEHKKGCPWQ